MGRNGSCLDTIPLDKVIKYSKSSFSFQERDCSIAPSQQLMSLKISKVGAPAQRVLSLQPHWKQKEFLGNSKKCLHTEHFLKTKIYKGKYDLGGHFFW